MPGASRRAARNTRDRQQQDTAPVTAASEPEATAPQDPVTPEPEVTEQQDAQQPEPEQDQPAQEDTPVTEEPASTEPQEPENTPEPEPQQDAEPQAVTEDTAPEPAPEPEAPASDPAPETQPEQEQEEPSSYDGLLQLAGQPEAAYDVRTRALARAAAMLVAKISRTAEPGQIVTKRVYISGENGRSVAAAKSLAQLAHVLGADMKGRAVTHDNVKGEALFSFVRKGNPAYADITHHEDFLPDVLVLLAVAAILTNIPGIAARNMSREARKARKQTVGTYDDNMAERRALAKAGSDLALLTAMHVRNEELTPEEMANFKAIAAHVLASAPALRQSPKETRWSVSWNAETGGITLPQMYRIIVPAPAPEQQATATAAA